MSEEKRSGRATVVPGLAKIKVDHVNNKTGAVYEQVREKSRPG